MIMYDESVLNDILKDPSFNQEYEIYKRDTKDLHTFCEFIDRIEFNKKYFRLSMGKQGYKKKNYVKTLSSDTIAIKEINSYLNKITDDTILKITAEIQTRLVGRDYLQRMILETLVEKCLLYPQYIPTYLRLLSGLYPDPQIHPRFMECIQKVFEKVLTDEINTEESEYLQFCSKNKRLDKIIGHSLLITECEKKGLVEGQIHHTLQSLLEILSGTTDNDEKYKGVQCIYTIMKSLYGTHPLPEGYNLKLHSLIETETSNKIKFKLMDIVDRR